MLNLGKLSPESVRALTPQLPPLASLSDLIDLSEDAGAEHFRLAIEAASKDRQVDGVLAIYSPKVGSDSCGVATKGTAAAIEAAGVPVQVVNKVTEGRPHIVDMIKNDEIVMVINTVEERRNAIADSRAIRTSSLLARVTTFTTIFGAEAAVEGMKFLDKLDVYSVQELHAQLVA